MKILILNGPNLNLLGQREPHIYGVMGLEELINALVDHGKTLGAKVSHFQSNSEGRTIDRIHSAGEDMDAIILNPGAYSHYSYAIRDAISSVGLPVIEVHISNISAREPFRETSVTAPVCLGQISGLGLKGYFLALDYLADLLREQGAKINQ